MSETNPTRSPWLANRSLATRPQLERDRQADVCVIGAGIAGLSCAYHLAVAGRKVVVLDDGPIGGGETSLTTAHLTLVLDAPYDEVESMHGSEGAALVVDSHAAAIDRIESIVRRERISCRFERLNAYRAAVPGEADRLDRELQAAHRAGVRGVSRVDRSPFEHFDSGPCLRYERQAQFDPLPYLNALARGVEDLGGSLHGGTHVVEVRSEDAVVVRSEAGPLVRAADVVIATHTPIHTRVRFHTKQAGYLTYAIALELPRDRVTRALYYDSLDPYHYVRLAPSRSEGRELLLVGGEDHKTGQEDDGERRWAALEAWTRERFPMVEGVAFRWSGEIMEPADGVAYIGRDPHEPHTYVVTGDSGNGMTHGAVAGILITDLVVGRPNRWQSVYDPGRVSLRSAARFVRENANVAAQYARHVTPEPVDSVEAVAPGHGAVVGSGRGRLAVYREDSGAVHAFSAICPHLGCVVAWNSAERTWDCPCHGSRFDATGVVIHGPANRNLKEESAPEPAERRSRR